MNFAELLKDKPCACGMTHTCSIKHILVEQGANDKLSDLLGDYRKILLVADTNTYATCGEKIHKVVRRFAERACGITAGQGKYGHQNACAAPADSKRIGFHKKLLLR